MHYPYNTRRKQIQKGDSWWLQLRSKSLHRIWAFSWPWQQIFKVSMLDPESNSHKYNLTGDWQHLMHRMDTRRCNMNKMSITPTSTPLLIWQKQHNQLVISRTNIKRFCSTVRFLKGIEKSINIMDNDTRGQNCVYKLSSHTINEITEGKLSTVIHLLSHQPVPSLSFARSAQRHSPPPGSFPCRQLHTARWLSGGRLAPT